MTLVSDRDWPARAKPPHVSFIKMAVGVLLVNVLSVAVADYLVARSTKVIF
jgi:hypothetical protein